MYAVAACACLEVGNPVVGGMSRYSSPFQEHRQVEVQAGTWGLPNVTTTNVLYLAGR